MNQVEQQVDAILQLARQRGAAHSLPYNGAVLPTEAYFLLQHWPDAVLVDVRSQAEWQFVGVVPNALCVEWRSFPGMQPNPLFLAQLREKVALDVPLLLMCRSGARSDEAARTALQAGYTSVYNVLEGFEGDRDGASQRNRINGWKAHGLPWIQG